mmetsp:Transcript_4294/g.3757  ORF Transcript_4294/g.3757 Transcript_4294/m.3757 type:complete len:124 (+) Transcript_4294:28-399(+)
MSTDMNIIIPIVNVLWFASTFAQESTNEPIIPTEVQINLSSTTNQTSNTTSSTATIIWIVSSIAVVALFIAIVILIRKFSICSNEPPTKPEHDTKEKTKTKTNTKMIPRMYRLQIRIPTNKML